MMSMPVLHDTKVGHVTFQAGAKFGDIVSVIKKAGWPLDRTLEQDVSVGFITFHAGCKLRTLVNIASDDKPWLDIRFPPPPGHRLHTPIAADLAASRILE